MSEGGARVSVSMEVISDMSLVLMENSSRDIISDIIVFSNIKNIVRMVFVGGLAV